MDYDNSKSKKKHHPHGDHGHDSDSHSTSSYEKCFDHTEKTHKTHLKHSKPHDSKCDTYEDHDSHSSEDYDESDCECPSETTKYDPCETKVQPQKQYDGPIDGIIFMTRDEILSQISRSITKHKNSHLGVYYLTTISGKPEVRVILRDFMGVQLSSYVEGGLTLEDLKNDPLVTAISLKELRPVRDECGTVDQEKTDNQQTCFRTAAIKVAQQNPAKELTEIVHQLFGHEVNTVTKGYTNVEYVNKVLEEMGRFDEIDQDSSKESPQELPSQIKSDSAGKVTMFSLLTDSFSQQVICNPNVANKRLASYLVSNSVFGDLNEVELPKRDPVKVAKTRSEANRILEPQLRRLVSTFVSILLKDQSFCQTVVDGFNENLSIKNNGQDSLIKIIKCFSDFGLDCLELINKSLKRMRITSKEIIEVAKDYSEARKHAEEVLDSSLGPWPCVELPKRPKMILYDPGKYKALHDSVRYLHKCAKHLSKCSHDEQPGKIHLKNFCDHINYLVSVYEPHGCTPVKYSNRDKSIPLTLVCGKGNSHKFSLKNGKKVVIPSHGFDMEPYSSTELEEILAALDTQASGDQAFNELRSHIAKKIAQHRKGGD